MEDIFVVGNEAGDVDSIVSSLLVAHFLNATTAAAANGKARYRAVMPFPARDFRLRRDAVELFRMAGWEFLPPPSDDVPVQLEFLDQVEFASNAQQRIILTDANKLGSHLRKFPNLCVVGVYDHHRDEGLFTELDSEHRVVDETAGSCTSVILHHFANSNVALPKHLGVLALGCILLDTRNMGVEGRYSEVDKRALTDILQVRAEPGMYDKLMRARNDVSHLTMDELFALDYKEETSAGLGFATLMLPPRLLSAKGVEDAMRDMLVRRGLDLLCAITSPEEDATTTRGFYLYAKDASACDKHIVSGLTKNALSQSYLDLPLCKVQQIPELGFGLKPQSIALGKSSNNFSAWTVRAAITRKTMLPAMLELLAKVKL